MICLKIRILYLHNGLHEALLSEEVWEQAQIKVAAQAKKYEKVNSVKGEKVHLLSGLLKCPICGAGMYGNKSIKSRKDGTRYKDYFYYGCKHRNMTRGHKCDYKKQIHEEMLDNAVVEVNRTLVSNKKFAGMMKQKINIEEVGLMPFGLLLDLWECHKQYSGMAKPKREMYIDDIIPDGI